MKKLIFVLAFLLLAISCQAKIIYVNANGTADFNNIQAAISDANEGDTIIVADGIYTGDGNRDIDFHSKAITLRSEKGPQNCIIDCQGSEANPHRGFHFHNGETYSSALIGLKITDGWGVNGEGGGIYCTNNSSPTISKCFITGNYASNGGGICCNEGSSPTIEKCTISNNRGYGGGIYCADSSAKITNCVISNNVAPIQPGFPGDFYTDGGGVYLAKSSPVINNCIIIKNSASANGGGIYCFKGQPIICNCTISGNSATGEGGGIRCFYQGLLTVSNSILWSNVAGRDGPQMSVEGLGSTGYCPTVAIYYSNVQGGQAQIHTARCGYVNWGGGNIDVNPLFADSGSGDYHLKSQVGRWDPNSESWVQDDVTSPCIDAGNPGCPLGDESNEPNNIRRNMGAYGGTAEASKSPTNWRSIDDMTNDWVVDSNDLRVFVDYWLQTGECIPGDLNRSQSVDFNDFAIFGLQWSYPSVSEPGITYQIEKCDPNSFRSLVTEPAIEKRFSVTVKGLYIHFKDMMIANCCTEELGLEMTIEEDLITIYEIEYIPGVCFCICDYPVTATLGPFEPGTYTLEVYEEWGGFIGSTTVVINPPE